MAEFTLEIGRGAQVVESLLLRHLERLCPPSAEHLGEPPVRIVVPSHSLREHLLRRLTAADGPGAWLGLRVDTIHALAREIVERAGGSAPGADPLPILSERFAARQGELADDLGLLDAGLAAVTPGVRDLRDAGFDAGLLAAIDEAIADEELAVGPRDRERVRALLRVAAAIGATLEELRLADGASLYRAARDRLLEVGPAALPARTLLVHGFADAIGVIADLLETALATWGGVVLLDRPEAPGRTADRPAAGSGFTRRLEERLRARADSTMVADQEPPRPRLELLRCADADAEAEAIAQRVLRLLAQGVAPEAIGVVLRQAAGHRSLTRRLERLGVPYSAPGLPGSSLPAHRRLLALLALLERGGELPVERWLDIATESDVDGFRILLALTAAGCVRVGQLAELDLSPLLRDGALPVPLQPLGDGGDDGERTGGGVPEPAVRREIERTDRALRLLAEWQDHGRLAAHGDALERLLGALGWSPEQPATRLVSEVWRQATTDLPPELPLGFGEFRRLLGRAAKEAGREAAGGAGSGIQVLEVVEARARTFDHLFLLGLDRGVFPRRVREDPLFPDVLRTAIAREGHGVLPDLPVKQRGRDEEAYLFAQLLSAAPAVTLSWRLTDADGRASAVSPLVASLEDPETPGAMLLDRALDVPPLFGTSVTDETSFLARPADEWALEAGLVGSREEFLRLLPLALEAAEEEGPATAPDARTGVAATLGAVLDELDPDLSTSRGRQTWRRPGPYSGLIGPPTAGDPRLESAVWVTRLEALGRCPWQGFLHHLLRLDALPPALDQLPGLGPALVGSHVHAVLARIAADSGVPVASDLDEALAAPGVPLRWPAEEKLRRLEEEVAERLLAREGIRLASFRQALIARGRPLLDAARRSLVEIGGSVLGAETRGRLEVDGGAIDFRVDLVLRTDEGPELIDVKTGSPVVEDGRPDTMQRRLLAAIRSGRQLQAAVYALAADSGGRGSYLHVSEPPRIVKGERRLVLEADDPAVRDGLTGAASVLLEARREGVLPPRLTEVKREATPALCERCDVAAACLQHDSTHRIRQRQWVDRHRPGASGSDALLSRLWWLGAEEEGT